MSTDRAGVRELRGPVKPGGPGDVEVSDEPAEVKDDEKTKPKKKKTPEEIEAGKHEMGRGQVWPVPGPCCPQSTNQTVSETRNYLVCKVNEK